MNYLEQICDIESLVNICVYTNERMRIAYNGNILTLVIIQFYEALMNLEYATKREMLFFKW